MELFCIISSFAHDFNELLKNVIRKKKLFELDK